MSFPQQIAFGVVLAGGLLFVSLFYGWRQLRLLRQLRARLDSPSEEDQFQRQQARRRLVSSCLLLVLALLMAGALAFLEPAAHDLAETRHAQQEGGDQTPLTPEQKTFARIWGWYWEVFLLITLIVVVLAAVDLWSIRRYARQQYGRLQADRRAMIQRQVNRMRQERNERN